MKTKHYFSQFLLLTTVLSFVTFLPTTVSAQTIATKTSFLSSLFEGIKNAEITYLDTVSSFYFGVSLKGAIPPIVSTSTVSIATSTTKVTVQEKTKTINNFFNSILSNKTDSSKVTSATTSIIQSTSTTVVPVIDKNKIVTLTITNINNAGSVISIPNLITCYGGRPCSGSFPAGTVLTLHGIPVEGYTFAGWEGVSCPGLSDCVLTLTGDTQVNARFSITSQIKSIGTFTSIKHPEDNCYIGIGKDYCWEPLAWEVTNPGDLLINDNGKDYYLADGFNGVVDDAPLKLTFGDHTLSLTNNGSLLDKVKVHVTCPPGSDWNGTKCWVPNAKTLNIMKSGFLIIKSVTPDIDCGYDDQHGDCTAAFMPSTKVILNVIPRDGYVFNGWYGDCVGSTVTCTLIMDKDRSAGVMIK